MVTFGMGRRRLLRLIVRTPVEVSLYSEKKTKSPAEAIRVMSRDISPQGIALELENPKEEWIGRLQVGKTDLAVEFTLPGGTKSILALGKLIWLERPRVSSPGGGRYVFGLKFIALPAADRSRIKNYIRTSYEKMLEEGKKRNAELGA